MSLNLAGERGQRFLVTANASDLAAPLRPFTDEGVSVGSTKYAPLIRPFRDREGVKNATLAFRWGKQSFLFNAFQAVEGFLGNAPTFANPAIVPPTSASGGEGIGNSHRARGYLVNYALEAPLTPHSDLKVGATYDWQERDFSRSEDDALRASRGGYRAAGYFRLQSQWTPYLGIEFGGDYERRVSLYSDNYIKDTGQVTATNNLSGRAAVERSVFAQAKYDVGTFTLLAGSRHTSNGFAGGNVSSRVTGLLKLSPVQSLKLILGQSFRAPALFEVFTRSASGLVLGSLDLKPERAHTAELVHTYAAAGLFFQSLIYTAHYDGKIMRIADPTDATGRRRIYVNGQRFKASGLELEARYNPSTVFDAFLNLDLLLDTSAGDEVPSDPSNEGHFNFKYVPKARLKGGVSLRRDAWTFSLTGRYWTPTQGPEDAFFQPTPGSWVQGSSQTIPEQFTVSLSLSCSQRMKEARLLHTVFLKNAGDTDLRTPDYVRRSGLNTVPSGELGRQVGYSVSMLF